MEFITRQDYCRNFVTINIDVIVNDKGKVVLE